jgi:ABC-2 type transport system ATP-binding protein
MTTAISVTGLVKTFGPTRALDGLDLEVTAGEVHGFLGPNGSGKSTTIRVLLGLLRADSGGAVLLDGDPWHDAVELHRRLAYVPGEVTLWPTISGGEAIDLLGRLRGGLDERRRADLLERFDLDPRKKARTYSKGNRQKVALVAALASDAELLLLDEPTSGLDPESSVAVLSMIRSMAEGGRTVIMCTHLLLEAEGLADRIIVLEGGADVVTGTPSDLTSRYWPGVVVRLDAEDPTMLDRLQGGEGVLTYQRDASCATVQLDDPARVPDLVASLAASGVRLTRVEPHTPTLEDLYFAVRGLKREELAA